MDRRGLDGTQEIRMAPAALEFGSRGDKSIKGPATWNGIQVYERLNFCARDKLQLFALRADRTGLGRVYDSPSMSCRGEVKLPDKQGRLPWDAGYDKSFARFQPLLDK